MPNISLNLVFLVDNFTFKLILILALTYIGLQRGGWKSEIFKQGYVTVI